MSALAIIVNIILILISIVLIIAVLMQQGQRQGLGAIGGGAETFFGKNKAKSYEGKLETITKIAAVVFIVLAIVATILTSQNAKRKPDTTTQEPTTVETSAEPTDDVADAEPTESADEVAEPTDAADEATDDAADADATDAPEESPAADETAAAE